MARVNAEVLVKGDALASARLRELAYNAEEARSFFERVARLLMEQTGQRFERGFGWPQLADSTRKRKAREHKDPRVLRVTGTLERALTQWEAPGQRLDFEPDELIYGLVPNGSAYYGKFHQAGKGVPKRVLLKTTTKTRQRVRDYLREHLLGRE